MRNATSTSNVVWINEAAWDNMLELAVQHYPLETGGMLLGYRADPGECVVTAIVGPGPHARHRRYRFAPDHEYQQAVLEQHYWHSDGKETYLGDWHTHPDGRCGLSWLDKRVLARIAHTPSSNTTHPIMFVLAGRGAEWDLCAARYISNSRRLILNVCELETLCATFYSDTAKQL